LFGLKEDCVSEESRCPFFKGKGEALLPLKGVSRPFNGKADAFPMEPFLGGGPPPPPPNEPLLVLLGTAEERPEEPIDECPEANVSPLLRRFIRSRTTADCPKEEDPIDERPDANVSPLLRRFIRSRMPAESHLSSANSGGRRTGSLCTAAIPGSSLGVAADDE
jgi:hypothetical protein